MLKSLSQSVTNWRRNALTESKGILPAARTTARVHIRLFYDLATRSASKNNARMVRYCSRWSQRSGIEKTELVFMVSGLPVYIEAVHVHTTPRSD